MESINLTTLFAIAMPYLGGVNIVYVAMLSYIVPYVYGYLKRWWNRELAMMIITKRIVQSGHETNTTNFNAVSAQILLLNKNVIRSEELVESGKLGLFAATNKGCVVWKNITITYSIDKSEKGESITLTTKHSEDLQVFVREAIVHHRDREMKSRSSMDIHKFCTSIYKWFPYTLNVEKTRKNIYLDPEVEVRIFGSIEVFLESRDLYRARGIPYKKSIMLEGMPGTGKSATIYAISNYFKMPIHMLTNENIESQSLDAAISEIKQGLIMIEEIDTFFPKREEDNGDKTDMPSKRQSASETTKLSRLLQLLDGYACLEGCVIFLTTNFPDRIDAALKRPGRVDEIIHFTYATRDVAQRILMDYCGQICDIGVEVTTSKLINEIILPNIKNFKKIEEMLKGV